MAGADPHPPDRPPSGSPTNEGLLFPLRPLFSSPILQHQHQQHLFTSLRIRTVTPAQTSLASCPAPLLFSGPLPSGLSTCICTLQIAAAAICLPGTGTGTSRHRQPTETGTIEPYGRICAPQQQHHQTRQTALTVGSTHSSSLFHQSPILSTSNPFSHLLFVHR